MSEEMVQPPYRKVLPVSERRVTPPGITAGIPRYGMGAARSVYRLKNLNFDPIGELVSKYRELEIEVTRQEKIRSGMIVELTSLGKTRAYNVEVHHALYDKLILIAEKLLRYGYGRVPEVNVLELQRPQPLVINTTRKGEAYVINAEVTKDDDVLTWEGEMPEALYGDAKSIDEASRIVIGGNKKDGANVD